MRWGALLLLIVGLAGGCASQHSASNTIPVSTLRTYRPAASAALVFDPPVSSQQPDLDLDREGRATEAFVGYESLSATYFYLRTDDRQLDYHFGNNGNYDRFERRAVSTKVGAVYR